MSAQSKKQLKPVDAHKQATGKGKTKPRLSPKQGRALLRRAALIRIGQWRHANGVEPVNLADIALVIADIVVFDYGGLTLSSLNRLAAKMQACIPESIAVQAIERVEAALRGRALRYRMFSDRTAGRLLGLTRFERHLIEQDTGKAISTVLGTDETREEVKAERKERKDKRETTRKNQKKRKIYVRNWKTRQRRNAGAVPRAEYEANSASRTKPWEAFGISERTWRRRGKPTPPVGRSAGTQQAKNTPENTWEIGDRSAGTACKDEVLQYDYQPRSGPLARLRRPLGAARSRVPAICDSAARDGARPARDRARS